LKGDHMPSPHDTLFPDDLDRVARWRREDEQQKEEFARQRAREERVQQSKVQTMDSETQAAWDAWADARIEARAARTADAVGDALGMVARDLRREIAVVREAPPPLFAAPDKALSKAMTRVGTELHEQKEAIAALRADVARCAPRKDITDWRCQTYAEIRELQEHHTAVRCASMLVVTMNSRRPRRCWIATNCNRSSST
jgi:hypothetical protein